MEKKKKKVYPFKFKNRHQHRAFKAVSSSLGVTMNRLLQFSVDEIILKFNNGTITRKRFINE